MNGNSFREWEGSGNENPHWREWESISLSRRPGVSNASNAKIPILVGRIGSGVRVMPVFTMNLQVVARTTDI